MVSSLSNLTCTTITPKLTNNNGTQQPNRLLCNRGPAGVSTKAQRAGRSLKHFRSASAPQRPITGLTLSMNSYPSFIEAAGVYSRKGNVQPAELPVLLPKCGRTHVKQLTRRSLFPW